MRQILVYDDNPEIVKSWSDKLSKVHALKGRYEIKKIETAEFVSAIDSLKRRRAHARNTTTAGTDIDRNLLDTADVFIVDFDLLTVPDASLPSGEEVAYLARCFSSCKFIIALNQFGSNPFDLTLRGHPRSYADLNLGSEQIDNAGLWDEPWKGYRPWYWPLVPLAVEKFENRVNHLKGNLDKPILQYLGIGDEIITFLPQPAIDFLNGKITNKPIKEITFSEFVLGSGSGLQGKDKPIGELFMRHISVSRISKWIERLVLPGQDLLVDIPHLISRYPSLLRARGLNDLNVWNRVVSLALPSRKNLDLERIEKFKFGADEWISRPAWVWPLMSKSNDIEEVKNPWSSKERPDFVFCEDISSFLPREETREFNLDLSSPFLRRYVANASSKHVKRFAQALQAVQYSPTVRLVG